VDAVRLLSSEPMAALAALTAIGALSRGVIVALLATVPPARAQGLGVVAANPPGRVLAAGLVLAVLPGFALLGFGAMLALTLAVALAALVVGWLCRRYLGGYTGDGLGAGQQAGEVTALLILVA
jgi:adenosylcobinamide-GDP ribazoletransferase